MKKGIHPKYQDSKVNCSCGNVIELKSTKEEIHVEICSKCHPFYTGKQSSGSKDGKVEKFNKKYGFDKVDK